TFTDSGGESHGAVVEMLRACAAQLLLATLAFLLLYVITGPEGSPGGSHFALLVLYLAALWVGKLTAPFKKLPPLLPMLLVGFLLRNVPELGTMIGKQVDPEWSSALRLSALTLILTRAGLAMDLNALLRLRFVVLRLAMLPCLCEATAAALLATWLLDFPPLWAAMLGFVVAAISPAVVVPSLLALQDQGFGVEAGIPTMVVAAAPLDDVLSIAGFGICLGISFAESSWLNYARAPLELLLGLGTGMIGAALLAVLTPSSNEEEGAKDLRLLLLLSAALCTAFGLREVGFSGAAALAVLVLGAGCARGWGPAAKPVSASIADLWTRLAQPLLFSLVGASVVVTDLETETLAGGLLIIFIAGLVRFCAVMLALSGRGMKQQEKFFTAIAWTPKATVQAALGGLALDEAREDNEELLGRRLLAVAVLCILVTAPPGATLIALMGPRLLQKVDKPEVEDTGLDKPEMDVVPAETLPGFLQRPAELEFQNTTWSPRIGCGKIGRRAGELLVKHVLDNDLRTSVLAF
ncbi:unnamed protein product, partial [Cladocopium goreaui]